jgi:hypothetical protein
MTRLTSPYKRHWEQLEANGEGPKFASAIIEMDYNEFAAKTCEADPKFIKEITESLYSGEAYILKSAISKKTCQYIIDKTIETRKNSPSEFYKMLDGVPNFHRIIDSETTKKYSTRAVRHSFYFFRWNNDILNVWQLVTPIWRVLKYVGGFDKTIYEKNIPSDLIVDRLQVVRYPSGGGGLKTHIDAYHNQKLIFGIMLSERGKNYKNGGFYVMNSDNQIWDMENKIESGDIVTCYPTIEHGVVDVEPEVKLDWESNDGRWFVGFYSNDTNYVQNRQTSTNFG